MAIEQNKIKKPYALLCEGADALYFLIWLLGEFSKENTLFQSFQVFDFKGITELCHLLETFQLMQGYQNVKAIGVIRDAETDHSVASRNICSALKKFGLPAPSKPFQISKNDRISSGFVLFPSCSDRPVNGTLEDLCLEALRASDARDILHNVEAVLSKYTLARPHKNRLHGYFSCTDRYVGLKIGEASNANAFDVNSPSLKSLKDFLLNLVNA